MKLIRIYWTSILIWATTLENVAAGIHRKEHVITKGSDVTLSCDGCTESNQASWFLDEHDLNETVSQYTIVNVTELDVGEYICTCNHNDTGRRQEHRLILEPEEQPLQVFFGSETNNGLELKWRCDVSHTNKFGVVHPVNFEQETSVSYAEVLLGEGSGCSGGQLRLKPPVVLMTEGNSVTLSNLTRGSGIVITVNFTWVINGQHRTTTKVVTYSPVYLDMQPTTVYWTPFKNATLDASIDLSDCEYRVVWISLDKNEQYVFTRIDSVEQNSFIWNVPVVIPEDGGSRIAVLTTVKPTIGSGDLQSITIVQRFDVQLLTSELLPLEHLILFCRETTTTSIRLDWLVPPFVRVDHPTKFRIVYWMTYDMYTRKYVDVDSSLSEFVVTDLQPGANYKFAIVAFDTADRVIKVVTEECATRRYR